MTPPRNEKEWRLPFLAGLLLLSGACGLVYQTAWLREFRLIFGGSTAATAAVLAVFMGGLGVGGAWWGRRAERSPDLLRMYARLEIGIGVSAAATPFLLDLVRMLYVRTGGVLTLGTLGATVAQLALTALVLGVPCVLLGGNLPPALKWIASDRDPQRGALGVIYGCNAFGAVFGVLLGTFWALEHLGTRTTLWLAATANVGLGVLAWFVAVRTGAGAGSGSGPAGEARVAVRESVTEAGGGAPVPPRFVYGVAALTGFLFFLSELVWYRMLTPLLGGSVYCFGLILAEVLLGIAVGGWIYRGFVAGRPGRSNLGTLALLAGVQAVALAAPWALGDRLAVVSFHLHQWRGFGFGGLVAGWSVTVATLVLGPAIVAGIQFPLLVALLGSGRREAARHVGFAYAANTAGAIAGSILGGFLLLPWLTAPGCWRLVVALTVALAFAALLVWERPWRPGVLVAVLVTGGLAGTLGFQADGPTAAWRHTSLGYGVITSLPTKPDELEDLLRAHRRHVAREYEGRESSIAVMNSDEGWSLLVNGKADGSALSDAGTQIMLGLVGAIQHPHPRTACVIGLGTGASAGWLSAVPGMERVEVVELEPRVIDAARDFFAPVNRNVLQRTNVHVVLGDAREVLLAADRTYDLVVSEPSNPYRAGVASLFTREYYQAVHRRLAPGGIFGQWLQGYQLSVESVQVVYATLLSVFPHVETWVTQGNDLLFVCRDGEPAYGLETLRARLASAPFDEALARAWGAGSVESFLARHVAGTETARRAAAGAPAINTDDRNILEYGLARVQSGAGAAFHYQDLLHAATSAGDGQPAHLRAGVDQARLLEARLQFLADEGETLDLPSGVSDDARSRAGARRAWVQGDHAGVLRLWRGPAETPAERLMLALSAGRAGSPDVAQPWIRAIARDWPADAALATAWVAVRHGAPEVAVQQLTAAFEAMRQGPWVRPVALTGVSDLMAAIVTARPQDAPALLEAWRRPLSVGQLGRTRVLAWYRLASRAPPLLRLEILDDIGPHHPWTGDFLSWRWRALEAAGHPTAGRARRDLARFQAQVGREFSEVLPAAVSPETAGH